MSTKVTVVPYVNYHGELGAIMMSNEEVEDYLDKLIDASYETDHFKMGSPSSIVIDSVEQLKELRDIQTLLDFVGDVK